MPSKSSPSSSSCLRFNILISVALTLFPLLWITGILNKDDASFGPSLDRTTIRETLSRELGWNSTSPIPLKSATDGLDQPTKLINTSNNNSFETSLPSRRHNVTADARHADGSPGYIADPRLLKLGVADFVGSTKKPLATDNGDRGNSAKDDDSYWQLLNGYDIQSRNGGTHRYYADEVLTSDYICGFGPGQGIEEPPGYKLLTEKIRIAGSDGADDSSSSSPSSSSSSSTTPRVFCGIYTYSPMRELVRTQALSWGHQCDGFLAFSNETVPHLGIVDLVHDGDEDYQNMWHKVRGIWTYIYKYYLDEFDYFHMGGDDMYVIVPNLKRYLALQTAAHQAAGSSDGQPPPTHPLHMGQWLPNKNMISGGPGYTLNAAALRILVEDAFPTCKTRTRSSAEDRLISGCLQSLGINATDTRDIETGEQQYHDDHPSSLYTFRSSSHKRASYLAKNARSWEQLRHPTYVERVVGPRHELEAAAKYSVSFHHLYNPQYIARFHSILRPETCPSDSPLGRGLRIHGRRVSTYQ